MKKSSRIIAFVLCAVMIIGTLSAITFSASATEVNFNSASLSIAT